jgi:hypothetical protein
MSKITQEFLNTILTNVISYIRMNFHTSIFSLSLSTAMKRKVEYNLYLSLPLSSYCTFYKNLLVDSYVFLKLCSFIKFQVQTQRQQIHKSLVIRETFCI